MLLLIGRVAGALFCLYAIVFRWRIIWPKYGRFGLYWWFVAVTGGCTLLAYLVGLAILGVLYAIWTPSN
jgi:hypothetical protein